MRRTWILAAAVAAVVAGCGSDGGGSGETAARGDELFAAHCAVCHGPQGQGTTTGPPLVHQIYEPSHHPDESFHRAVSEGVTAHHWEFGDMPPVPGLDDDEVDAIIGWVRQQQRDAGIE